jgi:hypothetical protein
MRAVACTNDPTRADLLPGLIEAYPINRSVALPEYAVAGIGSRMCILAELVIEPFRPRALFKEPSEGRLPQRLVQSRAAVWKGQVSCIHTQPGEQVMSNVFERQVVPDNAGASLHFS